MIEMQRLVRSLPERPLPPLRQAALAVGCVAAGTGLHLLLEPRLEGSPFITFFPAVLVASVWGGLMSGVIALLLGSATASYFWLEPFRTVELTAVSVSTVVLFLLMGSIILLGAHLLHMAVAMAREAEARANLVAREMQHRIGNKLAIIQSIARLSVRHASTLQDFERLFSERLRALSDAQALAGNEPELPTDLKALLQAVIRPFDVQRITLSGPPVAVEHHDRPMLALLVHELGTNAVKHGALSRPEGTVSIRWSRNGRDVRLDWSEAGGPPVGVPGRKGFGNDLVRAAFPPDRGTVSVAYEPAGVRCAITFHAAEAASPPRALKLAGAARTPQPGS